MKADPAHAIKTRSEVINHQCRHPTKCTVTDLMMKTRLCDKHSWFGL